MNSKEIQRKIQERFASKSEEDLIKEDEYVLMANYLSEIEGLQIKNGFNRKDLALKINTSPSYLTQVFRGDKPLNFYTIAKIQRALNIRFGVAIRPKEEAFLQAGIPQIKNTPFRTNSQSEDSVDMFFIQGGKFYDAKTGKIA